MQLLQSVLQCGDDNFDMGLGEHRLWQPHIHTRCGGSWEMLLAINHTASLPAFTLDSCLGMSSIHTLFCSYGN